MINKRHVLRTEDESIWIDFDGEVPRVGDKINLKLINKEYEIKKEHVNKEWIVFKVDWFFSAWRVEPHPSTNYETLMISQARVFIK